MNTKKDNNKLNEKGNQNLLGKDEIASSVKGFITPLVTNPSPEILLISRSRSLYNNNYNIEIDEEKREGYITSLVTIAISKIGGLICDHILKYGATTIPELESSIPTTKASASRVLNRLQIFGSVEKTGYVRSPYRLRNTPGPLIPIYALKGADPQASLNAQRRYGAAQMKQDPEKREKEIIERETEARAIAIQKRRNENLNRVLETIKPPIQKLGPLYEVLNRLEINDPDDRAAIRDYFVEHVSMEAND